MYSVRLLGREPLPVLLDHDRELELVVELLGEVLRIDDRLVRPDDRVDVLEEDDPWRDLVRPVDLLRLLLVLAEVARRVEELLRDDRRAQRRVLERDALARVVGTAFLEELAHGRNVEHGDLVTVEHPDHTVLAERDELHDSTIFQKESFTTISSPRNVHRSQPRTSSCCPSTVVPVSVHSEAPRSPETK